VLHASAPEAAAAIATGGELPAHSIVVLLGDPSELVSTE
jgi:hypothetical protein